MAAVDEFYGRKLSRSPKNKEFFHLSEADRRLISELRSVMHGVHRKVSILKGEMDENYSCGYSSSERRHTAMRPGHMVDMNKELHQRLQRANNWNSSTKTAESDAILPGYYDEDNFYSRRGRKRSWDLDDLDFLMSNFNRRRHVKRRGLLRRQSFSSSDMESDVEQLSLITQNDRKIADAEASGKFVDASVRITTSVDDNLLPSDNEAGIELNTTSYPMDVSAALQSTDELNDLHRAITKCDSGKTVYFEHAIPGAGAGVLESMDNYNSPAHRAPVKETCVAGVFGAVVNLDGVGGLKTDISSSVARNTCREIPICERSDELAADDALEARVGVNKTKPVASAFMNASFKGSLSKQLSGQIVALLSEIDSAKDLNIQLHDRLLCAEAELEAVKQICRSGIVDNGNVETGIAAAMVQELWQANCKRERELAQSLQEVLDERDNLLEKLAELRRLVTEQQSADVKLAQKQMKSVGTTTTELNEGRHTTQDNRQSMPEVISTEKGSYLQEEVSKLQKEHLIMEEKLKIFEKRQLLAEDERDFSLAKVARLEEELAELQQSRRFQNPFPDMLALRDEVTIARAELEWQKSQLSAQIATLEADKFQLIDSVKELTESNSSMKDELTTNEEALRHCRDESNRLERVVSVLRKKISILGANIEEN